MSYVAPVVINSYVSSETIMGLIIAFSSIVGISCDILFTRFFRRKPFTFFLGLTLLAALLFPLTMSLLPPIIPVFLLATGIWGIYYEAIMYSNYIFVAQTSTVNKHESAWAQLNLTRAAAWTIAPLVATSLMIQGSDPVYQMVILLLFLGSMLTIVAKKYWIKKENKTTHANNVRKPNPNFYYQLRIWKILTKKVWPLLLFLFVMLIIDATFWTIGTVMAETMKEDSVWGGLLLSAYMLPSLLFSGLAIPLAKPFGKKKIALILGIGAGLSLATMALTSNPALIVGGVFVTASFMAVIWPEISATFENYVVRLHEHSLDMIGLNASTSSMAYILGPILAGLGAALLGYRLTFAVLGILLATLSVTLLFVVPRKIKMPQKAISQLESR